MTKNGELKMPKSCDANNCDQCGKCEKPGNDVLLQVNELMDAYVANLNLEVMTPNGFLQDSPLVLRNISSDEIIDAPCSNC